MYCIFSNLGDRYKIFYIPTPLHKRIVWGGHKNDATGMIDLLTFQSINNLLYFLKIGWGIEIFLYPHPIRQKIVLGGGTKNDMTEMIHLLTFQSTKNVLYIFLILGGYRNIFVPPPPTLKETLLGGV